MPTRTNGKQRARLPETATWRELVYSALKALDNDGEGVPLQLLYDVIDGHSKAEANPHWKAKIRQTVQLHPEIESVSKGVWRVSRDDAEPGTDE